MTIDWSVIRKADSSAFTLRWCETGGPPMPASDRKGFGSRLILRVLPMELGGTAQVNYGPDGLIFMLETTMQAIEESVPGD
ncbi:Blue-light-activated histidine kinase [compost metagenome]